MDQAGFGALAALLTTRSSLVPAKKLDQKWVAWYPGV